MRSTNWDQALIANSYCYSALAQSTFHAAPKIPHDQYLQFRRIRTKLAILAEQGLDIEVMTSEQVYGSSLVAPQKARVYWSRCEYDFEVTEQVFNQIEKNMPLLKAWFTTNLTGRDQRLISVPLGLNDFCGYSNFHQIAGMTEYFKIPNCINKREQTLFCCLNPNTRLQTRLPLVNVIKTLPQTTFVNPDSSLVGFKRYLQNLYNSEFTVCPRGNGIDTHRFWEALYAGSIPICLDSELLPCHRGLPHLAVRNWVELIDLDFKSESDRIRKQSFDLRSLCVDYWVDRVVQAHNS